LSWIIALVALTAGLGAGYYLARHFGDSQQRERTLQAELDQAREEHATYRHEVSEHFTRTALAVNQLTESYRSVHQHLSEGAHALCDNAAAEAALAFDQSPLIDSPVAPTDGQKEAVQPSEEGAAPMPGASTNTDPQQAPVEAEVDEVVAPDDATPDISPETPPDTAPNTHSGDESTATKTAVKETLQPPRDYADENDAGFDKTPPKSG